MHRHLEHNYHVEELATSGSPPHMHQEREQEWTAFGPMDNYTSRKTLYLLIGTLNHAFPDHDFSNLRPDNFARESSGAPVLNALSTTLVSHSPSTAGAATARSYSAYPATSSEFFPSSLPTSSSPPYHKPNLWTAPQIVSGTHPTLYKLLDDVIKLDECEVYTYTPDLSSDPHATDSDDSDAEAWDSDETSSLGSDDDGVFEMFDEEEFPLPSTAAPSQAMKLGHKGSPRKRPTLKDDEDTSFESDSASPTRTRPRSLFRKRSGGGFLWSTHTFFHNRKQKRILYITTWARKKTNQNLMTRSYDLEGFRAWDGATGAGARAFGLKSRSLSVSSL